MVAKGGNLDASGHATHYGSVHGGRGSHADGHASSRLDAGLGTCAALRLDRRARRGLSPLPARADGVAGSALVGAGARGGDVGGAITTVGARAGACPDG